MVFIHIDQKNCMDGKCNMVEKLDSYIGNKSCKTFILIFMEGCGPCNATRPEWSKLKNVISNSKIGLIISFINLVPGNELIRFDYNDLRTIDEMQKIKNYKIISQ